MRETIKSDWSFHEICKCYTREEARTAEAMILSTADKELLLNTVDHKNSELLKPYREQTV